MGILDPPGMAVTQVADDTLDARKMALLRPFHVALASRSAAAVKLMFVGDSTDEGARSTGLSTRSLTLIQSGLRSRYGQSAGGFGYIKAWYGTGDITGAAGFPLSWSSPSGDAVTTRTRSTYGLGRMCVVGGSGDVMTLTLTSGGPYVATSVDVHYAEAAVATSALEIRLDGSLLTTLNTVNPSPRDNRTYRVTVPDTSSTHTITVTFTGQASYLCGFEIFNGDETSGIHVYDSAVSGANSALWAGVSPTTYWLDRVGLIQPHLLVFCSGINDFFNSSAQTATPTEYQTNLTSALSNIRARITSAPAVVFAPRWERGGNTAGLTHQWAAYLAAMRAVVAADGSAAIFDLHRRFPAGAQVGTFPLINSADLTHPTDAGYRYIAEAFVNWVLPR